MKKITEKEGVNLYIGSKTDYRKKSNSEKFAFVHACKTVHCERLGWSYNNTSNYKGHPNYLHKETSKWLSINWVDGPAKYYNMAGTEMFEKALDFIENKLNNFDVLVHCDQGVSRSPTVGLLYLSKREETISSNSFIDARKEFIDIYPEYDPKGIANFVAKNWCKIN